MRLRPIHLSAIPLAVVAITLACDLPVSPPADAPPATATAPAPVNPSADVPTTAPTPGRSSLERVGSAAHSVLGLQEHLDLHVGQARQIEEDSDARLLDAFRAAGASEEVLERMRLSQEASRNLDAENFRDVLTTVLTR